MQNAIADDGRVTRNHVTYTPYFEFKVWLPDVD